MRFAFAKRQPKRTLRSPTADLQAPEHAPGRGQVATTMTSAADIAAALPAAQPDGALRKRLLGRSGIDAVDVDRQCLAFRSTLGFTTNPAARDRLSERSKS